MIVAEHRRHAAGDEQASPRRLKEHRRRFVEQDRVEGSAGVVTQAGRHQIGDILQSPFKLGRRRPSAEISLDIRGDRIDGQSGIGVQREAQIRRIVEDRAGGQNGGGRDGDRGGGAVHGGVSSRSGSVRPRQGATRSMLPSKPRFD